MVNIHLYIISLLLISILSLLLSRPIPTDAVAADPPPPPQAKQVPVAWGPAPHPEADFVKEKRPKIFSGGLRPPDPLITYLMEVYRFMSLEITVNFYR